MSEYSTDKRFRNKGEHLDLKIAYQEIASHYAKKRIDEIVILRSDEQQLLEPTVAESKETGTKHLEFAKSLFKHYYTYLGLTNNSWPTESAFNCYVNEKIVYYLENQEDPKSAFNNFFSKLFQSTTFVQNYLFASLITEINKEIERYTKQRFPITFADKEKERLQT
ncbi:hypothetical protein G9A89_016366 [Geosiphon pyriformis]|nr:hypothetical protein G9A89_016366 [Geosiphon pyriformis]